mmetsp:Transcript_15888/g.45678  ORF Transcript_15888/g.45678 Transcript_15888/m.45678 type:complete len:94 (-) Transcript_15888:885-1166(-)
MRIMLKEETTLTREQMSDQWVLTKTHICIHVNGLDDPFMSIEKDIKYIGGMHDLGKTILSQCKEKQRRCRESGGRENERKENFGGMEAKASAV